MCERSLFIASARYDDDSVEVAEKEVNLAIALQSVGRLRRAAMLARSGLSTLEARLPADHPDLELPRNTLQSIENSLETKEQTP